MLPNSVEKFQCWICDVPVPEPLYWIDPRDYDVGHTTKILCGPECAQRAYERVKHTFKPRLNPEDSQ